MIIRCERCGELLDLIGYSFLESFVFRCPRCNEEYQFSFDDFMKDPEVRKAVNCYRENLKLYEDSGDDYYLYRGLLLNLRPYHVTTLNNLIKILEMGFLVSKSKLASMRASFEDPGVYDNVVRGQRYLFEVIRRKNSVEYKYEPIKADFASNKNREVRLEDYVRFFIFVINTTTKTTSRYVLPLFAYKIINDALDRDEKIALIILKRVEEVLEYAKDKHLLVYGPGAGFGQFFRSFDDFITYASTPSPDPLKNALQKLLFRPVICGLLYPLQIVADRNTFKRYYEVILESELAIFEKVPLNIIDKVVILTRKIDQQLSKQLEELNELMIKHELSPLITCNIEGSSGITHKIAWALYGYVTFFWQLEYNLKCTL